MNAADILSRITKLNVVVVGDICLDRWSWYDPATAEPSRETGIPRTAVVRTETTPGAGGTIANNLVALGVQNVSVLGVIGQDGFGWELLRALEVRHIVSNLLVASEEVNTFTYTKLLNINTSDEDRPRVDFINTQPLSDVVEAEIFRRLESVFPSSDVVLISDQAETNAGGVITPRVRDRINELALNSDKVVWVDSRMRAELFRSVVLKPNEDEAAAACSRLFGTRDLHRLFRECELRALIVTHGERGSEVINNNGSQWLDGRKVKAIDICGAGDSFSAGAACALAVTGSEVDAARFGNLIASITVTKKGTGTASPDEIIHAEADLAAMNTLAIDIGGTKFGMAIFDGRCMVARESRATDREGGRAWMMDRIAEIGRGWRAVHAFERCGIGFGGPVIFSEQRVALSTHVGGWSDFDLPGFIRSELDVEAVMDNDANVGALGEALHGAGQGCDPLFYMTLSTGIGGGIVHRGRVYRGADSYAGEIGHLTIRPGGPECLCGARGCFERMCCGLWLEKDHGQSAKELMMDPAFVERYVVDLALGLKSCIMLLNPARIVIGGGIGKAGDALFVPLRAELRRQITTWSRARIDVVPAELGDDSVLWGARALAQENL